MKIVIRQIYKVDASGQTDVPEKSCRAAAEREYTRLKELICFDEKRTPESTDRFTSLGG
jgi:hypothetical protein